tara:strand:- start:3560 stop:4363 length:804 start_codon:yes stop_codon:yes gene_type:complete
MAQPNTRQTLISYAKRALGHPVIEINVDDDQIDDRVDEALQYWQQYHYDGIKRTYLKWEYTQAEQNRILTTTSEAGTKNSVTSTWKEDNNYIVVPETVFSVTNIFPFSNKGNLNLFDVRYQLRLNDLYDFSSTSVINYDVVMRQLDFLDHILVGEKPLRFNQHDNRLYIDMDWKNDLQIGEHIVIECYRKMDPDTYTDVYNDIWLKKYTTALVKKQWGANLSKFAGVAMIGGVTLNGEQIYTQALADIEKLEEEIKSLQEHQAMLLG